MSDGMMRSTRKLCVSGRREIRRSLAAGWVPLRIRGKAWEEALYRDCLAAELRVSVLEERLARVLRVAGGTGPPRGRVWSGKRSPAPNAAKDADDVPRCARCGEVYRSLMNPRWRGYPWECGKCGCLRGHAVLGEGRASLHPAMTSFDELCAQWNATPAERVELVWYLAAIRTRRLVEALLPAAPRPSAVQPAR